MADTITVKFKVMEDGSLKAIGKDADRASDALNRASKSSDHYSKKNKGVAGATANSTKAFSKMTTGIEGGLVPAYATLAAHVFAITAAFGVLQRNAAVAQLNEGIVFTGRAAGQNLPLVAQGLREITDNAISTTDALRSVAVGVSAGFSQQQLEGLTKVAKGASLALGRDMTDAMDRLVRGAAKLEPEILDELGIMVRLDETAEKYAASIGKTANSLTTFEKRMAFTNAIIEQGEIKFGALNEVIEANPYSKLAAQFDDLLKGLLNITNFFAGPIISGLAANMGLLVGVVGAFSGGIVRTMIPALTESGLAAAEHSDEMRNVAKSQIAASKVYKGAPKVYSNLVAKMKNGTASAEDMQKAQTSLTKSIKIHNTQMDAFVKKHGEGSKQVEMKKKKLAEAKATLHQLTAAQKLETQATIEATKADTLNAAATGNLKDTVNALKVSILAEMAATRASTASKGMLATALGFVTTGFRIAAFSAKAFGIALINAIPLIGQIIFLASLAFEAIKKLFSEPPSKMEEAMTNAREALSDFPNILEQMVTTYSMVNTDAERFEISLKAQAGIMQQITDRLREQIIVQRVAKAVEVGKAKAAEAMANVQVQQAEAAVENTGAVKKEIGWLEKLLGLMAAGNLARSGHHGAAGQMLTEIKAREKLGDALEEQTAATTALAEAEAKPAEDLTATIGNQLEIVSTGIETLKMFIAAQRGSSDENKLAADNLQKLTGFYNTLTSGTKVTLKQIEEVNIAVAATKNAADSAVEGLREVNEIQAKSRVTSGVFAAEIDALTNNLNNLGKEGEKYGEIAKKYEEAFKKLTGKGTEDAARDLLKDLEKVNERTKKQGELDAERKNRIDSLMQANLGLVAAEERLAHAKDNTKAAEDARDATLALQTSTAEEKHAAEIALLKAKNEQEKERIRLINEQVGLQSRLGGEAFGASAEAGGYFERNEAQFEEAGTSDKFKMMGEALNPMIEQARKLGPEGEVIAAVTAGAFSMAESFSIAFEKMEEGTFGVKDGLMMAANAVSTLGAIQKAQSDAAIAGIDNEIAAEKARDGKSAGSLAKIKAMEKKKEQMKRKAFEQDKKMKMAQVVMSTANAIMSAIEGPPGLPWSAVFGAAAAAMGAAQLAAISSTSFQGGAGASPSAGPSAISVGSRNASVDLAKGQNAGGELAYARGESGIGSSMTDFKPAFSGYKNRAAGGFVVGEQGPELFMPSVPGEIIPSGQGSGGMTNVNFSISTVDATGVEDLLMNQRGNIIGMIREAANEHGELFLESVQEKSY